MECIGWPYRAMPNRSALKHARRRGATAVASWKSSAATSPDVARFSVALSASQKALPKASKAVPEMRTITVPPGLVGPLKGGRCTIEARKEKRPIHSRTRIPPQLSP